MDNSGDTGPEGEEGEEGISGNHAINLIRRDYDYTNNNNVHDII